MITDIGTAVLPPDELNQANSLRSEMERIYSTATVCGRPGDDDPTVCYPLDPGTHPALQSITAMSYTL